MSEGLGRRLCVALVVVLQFVSVVGWAQEREAEQFQRLVGEGVAHFEAKRWDEAIEKFEAAKLIHDVATLDYNIGRALQGAGRCKESRARFTDYLTRDDLQASDRKSAAERLKELEACVERAVLVVSCAPQEAKLSIDGAPKACGSRLSMVPGRHEIEVSARGFESQRRELELAAGDEQRLEVSLRESALRAEPVAPVVVKREESEGIGSGWGYALMGVGGAALVAGLVVDGMSLSRASEIEEVSADRGLSTQERQERLDELDASGESARVWAASLYVGGAVFLGAGVVLWWLSGEEDSGEAVSWRVLASPWGMGLAGEF